LRFDDGGWEAVGWVFVGVTGIAWARFDGLFWSARRGLSVSVSLKWELPTY
jgi:hypothetical protein